VADVFGNGRVLLDLTMSRAAFEQTSRSLLYLAIWIAVCGIAVMIFSFWFMDHWVLKSVTDSVVTLRAGIAAPTSTNGKHVPLKKMHSDEIGELIDAVNATMAAFDASQAHIRASETCYRVLVETMPEAIVGVDRDFRLLFSNRALARLAGVSPQDDLVGVPLRNVLSPAFLDAIVARLPELSAGQPMEIGPLVLKSTGSNDRWVMAFLASVEPAPDLPPYTLVCMRDITAKLNAEREADQRRTEAMQAQKLAALGTLVAGVAHEVNNPNGIVNLNMNVLKRILERRFTELETSDRGMKVAVGNSAAASLKTEINAIVQETLAASERIKGLVASLKSFVQPEVNTPFESVEIGELILSSSAWVRHELRIKNCRLECPPSLHGLRVRGHAQQLQQVCINLLHNACDAATRPGMLILVGAKSAPDGKTVTLTVTDEGGGIPPELLEHVLDPFFTTRRGAGGMGLGLSISSSIVAAHGGTLSIKSIVGKGTVVTVTLPAEKEVPHVG
jgi:PAS domain S-box-containing protein